MKASPESLNQAKRVLNVVASCGVLLVLLVFAGENTNSGFLSRAPEALRSLLEMVPTREEPAGLIMFIAGVVILVTAATAQSAVKARIRRDQHGNAPLDHRR